jgi:membrane protein
MFKETISEWVDDRVPRLGASLAFYTLLSLAPLLVVVVAVAALVYGQDAARGQLVWQIQGLVGPEGARAIQGLVQGAYKPGTGLIATLLGVLTLAFGASSVVVELRDALNTISHVPLDPGNTGLSSIFGLVKERFYSFAMILGIGFLLLVSLVLNAWIAAMGKFFASALPTPESLLHVATFVISFLVITFLFAAIYKMLPDVRLQWSDVAVGASVTSLLFTLGKQLIGLYLGKTTFGSTYGAAGSLVIVLVWVYYSAQLFFLGAEFTKVYTKTFGSQFASQFERLSPTPDNVIIDPSTIERTAGNDGEIRVKLV